MDSLAEARLVAVSLPPKGDLWEQRLEKLTKYLCATDELDLRPHRVLGDFISCDPWLIRDLQSVASHARDYVRSAKVDRPLNILISASPGSGKSFLAKSFKDFLFKKTYDAFTEVNLASLSNYEDLIGVFEDVRSFNVRSGSGKAPFVFFDEIDSLNPEVNFFQQFLKPCSEGKYYWRGRELDIGPAILFFAMSFELSVERTEGKASERGERKGPTDPVRFREYEDHQEWLNARLGRVRRRFQESPASKLEDFYSRMDHVIHMPSWLDYFKGEDRSGEVYFKDRETVMIAAQEIKRRRKRTKLIEKAALGYLASFQLESVRELQKIVFLAHRGSGSVFGLEALPPVHVSGERSDEMRIYWKSRFPNDTLRAL
jgi:hypothetical protein